MPETEQQDRALSELVVKEAVGRGLDSPMRDSILEAVEEADGSTPGAERSLPLAGALFGAGAALGFLAGRQSTELEETPIGDIEEPDVIEEVVEETTESDEESTVETESEPDDDDEGGSSRLSRILVVLGIVAGIALLRRRLSGEEEEEWDPIEEFEPATTEEHDEGEDEETEAAEAEAGSDEGDDDGDEE